VGAHITNVIIEERAMGGIYKDLVDFLLRVQDKDLNKKSIEALAKSGALDSLGVERNKILKNIDEILKFIANNKKGYATQTVSLFAVSQVRPVLNLKDVPPATLSEKLKWERELLGFYISEHPLKIYEEKIKKVGAKPILEIKKIKKENTIVRVAGVVSQVKKILTKSGQPMVFVTIEDLSPEKLEIIVFNNTLEKTLSLWQENNVIVVEGRTSLRDGETKLICEKAVQLK